MAGLLTHPPHRAFPFLLLEQWRSPVSIYFHNESKDSQQRELLPIHTAFPFNLTLRQAPDREPSRSKNKPFFQHYTKFIPIKTAHPPNTPLISSRSPVTHPTVHSLCFPYPARETHIHPRHIRNHSSPFSGPS